MIHPLRFACISCATAAMLALPAEAVLLTFEPFDYPNSVGQGLNTLAGGSGWSGAWSDSDAIPTLATGYGSLSYPSNVPLVPQGGRIEVTSTETQNNNGANRLLETPINLSLTGSEYYSSALFRRSSVTGELTSVLFRSTDIRWYYGIDIDGFFNVAVNPNDAGQRVKSDFVAEADTTYLVVAKLRTNTGVSGRDEVFLKVFAEGSLVSEPLTDDDWDLRASGSSSLTLDRISINMSNMEGHTNEFDELRVGTTFADVTGIPEPSSAAMLAIGALMLARRRR